MHAIKYFVDTLGWECDSAKSINRSIREFLIKKVGRCNIYDI